MTHQKFVVGVALLALIGGCSLSIWVASLMLPFFLQHDVQVFNHGQWVIRWEPHGGILGSYEHLYHRGQPEPAFPGVTNWHRQGDWVYFRSQYGRFATLDLTTDSLRVYDDIGMVPLEHQQWVMGLLE
jgi:hypothetical protein